MIKKYTFYFKTPLNIRVNSIIIQNTIIEKEEREGQWERREKEKKNNYS